jgi:hypothetical protein
MSSAATVLHGEALGKSPALNLSGRIAELDGLRGIAIGMVLVWHLYFGSIETFPGRQSLPPNRTGAPRCA